MHHPHRIGPPRSYIEAILVYNARSIVDEYAEFATYFDQGADRLWFIEMASRLLAIGRRPQHAETFK
jgi:hypothetical protein